MDQFQTLICLALVEIVADFALENYANTDNPYTGILGATGYVGVVFLLIKSLRGSTILYVNGMWDGISSLVESLAAFVFLGERFVRWEQYLGLALTLVGLFLLKSRPGDIPPKGSSDINRIISYISRF